MSKTLTKMVVAMGAMSLLAGCQTFNQLLFAKNGQLDAKAQQQNNTLYTQRGTGFLRAGNNGLAIEAFNLAIATGEEPAPAYNGLGVAYARLDRPDLAYRFFKKATMGAPGNAVFARNFALLIDSPGYAVAAAKQRQALAFKPPINQPASDQAGLTTNSVRETGKLYRDENRQFSLVTAATQPATFTQAGSSQRKLCQSKQQSAHAGTCDRQQLAQTGSRTKQPGDLAVKQVAQEFDQAASGRAAPNSDDAAAPKSKSKSKTVEMPMAGREPLAKAKPKVGAQEPDKHSL